MTQPHNSTAHHAEVFIEGNLWGWQCLTPTCRQEATGYEDHNAAEVAMEEHVAASGAA